MLTKEEQLINCGWKSFEEYENMVTKICKEASGTITLHKNRVINRATTLPPTKKNVTSIYGELTCV